MCVFFHFDQHINDKTFSFFDLIIIVKYWNNSVLK